MSLSLSCGCGAQVELDETFAGQNVVCPECMQSICVPVVNRHPRVPTSGYALASMVLALVGMFTVVLSAVAILLGIAGLVSIARHRDRQGLVRLACVRHHDAALAWLLWP